MNNIAIKFLERLEQSGQRFNDCAFISGHSVRELRRFLSAEGDTIKK